MAKQAIFMSTIISVPLSNQLQVPFLDTRAIYEIRERHSNMYSWTALITSQLLVEIPWNIFGSSLYFICWYWTVGFPSDRGGFTYFMLGVLSPLYYTSIGQVSVAPFKLLLEFLIALNRLLRPCAPMQKSRPYCSASSSLSCSHCKWFLCPSAVPY